MTRHDRNWHLIAAVAAVVLLGSAAVGSGQFTSSNDRRRAILEGNWQSCREGDGQYAERVYDGKLPEFGPFELHMGPYHEFALFRGVQDEHRDHTSSDNLLRPHTVDVTGGSGQQKWDAAGMHLEVTLAGGSRDDCESWWVILRRTDSSSSH